MPQTDAISQGSYENHLQQKTRTASKSKPEGIFKQNGKTGRVICEAMDNQDKKY
jgi:hypothetical protein